MGPGAGHQPDRTGGVGRHDDAVAARRRRCRGAAPPGADAGHAVPGCCRRRPGCAPHGVAAVLGRARPYQPIPVDQNVTDQIALQIMEEQSQFPGVTAQTQGVVDYPPRRRQPRPGPRLPAARHHPGLKANHCRRPIGYSSGGPGRAGRSGGAVRRALTGATGTKTVSVNAAWRCHRNGRAEPPQAGRRPRHQHQPALQAVAQNALTGRSTRSKASGNQVNQGAAVVRPPTAGSWPWPVTRSTTRTSGPTASLSRSSRTCSGSGEPVLNYDTQGQYPPGSTFKVVTTAAAVADGDSITAVRVPGDDLHRRALLR